MAVQWRNSAGYGGSLVSYFFNRHKGLVVVQVRIYSPNGRNTLKLALDTGATDSVVSSTRLSWAGFDVTEAHNQVQIIMGGNVVEAPVVQVTRIEALGLTRTDFPVLAHTLPAGATVDGVLGLDFLRNQTLLIDFKTGRLDLT